MACLGDLLHLAVDVNGRTDEEEDQDGEAEQQQVLDLLVPSLLYLVGLADDRIDLGHLHRAQPGAAKDGVAHTLVEVGMRTVDIAPSEKDLRQPGQGDVFLDGQLDVAHGRTGQEVDLTFLVAKPAVSLRKVVGQESGQADVIRLVRFEGREDGVDRLLVFSSQDHLLRPGQQVGVGICRLMDRGQGVPVGVRLLEIGLFLLGRRAIIRHITIEGAILVVIAGCFTVYRALTAPAGDMVGGWALNWEQQYVGFVRLMYPFFGGLLLSRLGWLIRLKKRAFWWCSLIIVVMLSLPRFGGEEHYWMNGLYEASCILFLFPVIVAMGAGGKVTGKRSTAICKFLGDISYPIYITHYPIIYIYTAWVYNNEITLWEGLPYLPVILVSAIALAYGCLKLYDEPLRKRLTNRFLKHKKAA